MANIWCEKLMRAQTRDGWRKKYTQTTYRPNQIIHVSTCVLIGARIYHDGSEGEYQREEFFSPIILYFNVGEIVRNVFYKLYQKFALMFNNPKNRQYHVALKLETCVHLVWF